jgi:O-antigen/teichoic acid export membrane protein
VTQVVSKKIFPGLSCNGKLDLVERRKIRKNVYGLLIQKIGETTRNSFDSIVLSSLFGLVIVGIYSNYYFVMNSVIGFMAILLHSIIPIVGNSVATEDIEKNFNDFEYIHFGYMTIACVATSCLICLYQPFMDIWVGGKDLLFPFEIVIAFAVYFYLLKIGDIPAIYYSAAGLWWYGRYRYIIEAIINIILNIILGKIFGPIGIVLATIISIIGFSYWYSTYLIFKYYFGFEKIKSFLVKNVYYTLITITSSVLSYLGCNSIGLYKEQEYSIILFFAGALICSGISLSIIFIIFRNSKEFIQLKLKILGGMSNGINV